MGIYFAILIALFILYYLVITFNYIDKYLTKYKKIIIPLFLLLLCYLLFR